MADIIPFPTSNISPKPDGFTADAGTEAFCGALAQCAVELSVGLAQMKLLSLRYLIELEEEQHRLRAVQQAR